MNVALPVGIALVLWRLMVYKYKGERGDIWLNESEETFKSLKSKSRKKVRVICPECSEERIVSFYSLAVCGHSYHRGCKKTADVKEKLLGKRFGRLIVTGFSTPANIIESGTKVIVCICKCDCGNERNIRAYNLNNGHTTSCGCFRNEQATKSNKRRSGPLNPMFGRNKEKHPKYRKDVSDEERKEKYWQRFTPEYLEWRVSVYERDNYTCQCCHNSKNKLAAHHMNGFANFPEQRLDVNNGLTLCTPCHKKLHALLGGISKSCTRKECESVLKKMKEEFKQ